MSKKKIDIMHMMATTAIHQLGDISSDEPDLCTVTEEDEDNYYGMWCTGMGFFNIRFPKETTRFLTATEIIEWEKMVLSHSNGLQQQIKILGYTPMGKDTKKEACYRCWPIYDTTCQHCVSLNKSEGGNE